ncbi:MAG: hypothetical protein ACYCX3_14740, partial [Thermoleophilia bacterium]
MTADDSGLKTGVTSQDVRDSLVRALRLDLVGPGPGDDLATEHLPGWVRPSNWYLTGFLIPAATPAEQRADPDEGDDMEEVPETGGLAEENAEERKAAKKAFFPSSMGLSFLARHGARALDVAIRWGDYVAGEVEDEEGKPVRIWARRPQEGRVEIPLVESGSTPAVFPVPDSGGLQLQALVRPVPAEGIDGRL